MWLLFLCVFCVDKRQQRRKRWSDTGLSPQRDRKRVARASHQATRRSLGPRGRILGTVWACSSPTSRRSRSDRAAGAREAFPTSPGRGLARLCASQHVCHQRRGEGRGWEKHPRRVSPDAARGERERREREFLAPFFSGARFQAENKRGQHTHPNFFWAIRQYGSSSGYIRPVWSPCAPGPRTLCSRRARRRPWRRPRPSSSSGLSARRRPESPPGRRSPRRGGARIARQQRPRGHARPWPFVRNVTVQAAGQLTRSQPRRSLPQFAVRSPPSELDGRKRRLGRTPMTVWSPLPPHLLAKAAGVRDRNSILQAFFRFRLAPFSRILKKFPQSFPSFQVSRAFRCGGRGTYSCRATTSTKGGRDDHRIAS